MKKKSILLCGGSGLIGQRLRAALQENGQSVAVLSRQNNAESLPGIFYWDPERDFINPDALLNARAIVNLAGTPVAGKKWSKARKEEIIRSRVLSNDLLYKKLSELKLRPDVYVSASAIGYYGDRGEEALTESSKAGDTFLAETTAEWERAANRISSLGVRTVLFRIGVVLAPDGGALPQMVKPIKLMVGAPLGSGEQYVSWIHIDDVCAMFVRALTDRKMSGIYNAVSPEPVKNGDLMHAIAQRLDKPMFLPNVPDFVLRLLMGEMSAIVLESARVLPERITQAGFEFQYPTLADALPGLLAES